MRGTLLLAALLVAASCAPRPVRRVETRRPTAPPAREAPRPTPLPERASPPPAAPGKEAEGAIVAAYRRGAYRAVVEEYDRIQESFPAHLKGADDLFMLGMSHYYLEEDTKALRLFLEFQYRFPGDQRMAESLLMTAKLFRRLGKSERALDALRQAIARAPEGGVKLKAWEEKADILAGEGRYLEGLTVLDEAYMRSRPAEKQQVMTRIRELLGAMPPDLIAGAVLKGRWNFPMEDARKIQESRGVSETGTRRGQGAEAAGEGPVAVWREPEAGVFPSAGGEGGDPRPLARIGVMAPESGRMEAYGREVRRGVELRLETAAGKDYPFRVEAVYAGEGGGEDEEAFLDSMITAKGILVLIGPLLSSTAERVIPVAERRSMALLSPTASSPRLNGLSSHFFRNCFTLEQFGGHLANLASGVLGLSSFALFSPEDIYGQSISEYFRRAVEARGGAVLAHESFDVSLTDFSVPIEALKRAAGIPEPVKEEAGEAEEIVLPFDALFIPGYAESVGLLLPQLAFHDIDVKKVAVIGGSGLNSPRLAEVGEEYAEGTLFADGFFAGSPRLEVQRFVALYREKYGEDPGTFAAQAFDAAGIVLAALRGGADSREEMLAALPAMEGFQGVTGSTTLRPGGVLEREPFVVTVARGRLVSLETAPLEDKFP